LVHEEDMKARLDPYKAAPATQINGCVYCVDMHGRDARAKGETLSATTIVPS
jgi:hypothetical protein